MTSSEQEAKHPAFSPELVAFIAEAPLERTSIAAFVASAAADIPAGAKIADIGAGDAPYRELFRHVEYVTIDHEHSPHATAADLEIVASADRLPVRAITFDAVVCTQVLEHLNEPQRAVSEFHRVLRPGGKLYLTAPLVWEEHEMPHDYFRYTSSGLRHLLTQAGFEDIEISPRTDAFTSIAQLLLSARWSLPGSGPVVEERQPEFARLEAIANEVLEMAPHDGRRALPLGWTVRARRPEATTARAASQTRTPIVYIAPWVDLGGSDKGTIDWFKHIDRDRWAPSLITTQASANRWLPQLEPYAEEIWVLPEIFSGAEMPGFILGFIESRGVEVVHIMNSRLAFDLMPDMTCLAHPPVVVVQLHAEEHDRSGYVKYVSTRYGNLVDAFSVTSNQLAEAMDDYLVPAGKLHVIPTGVDADEEFAPGNVAPFTGLPGSGPRILWPGRLAAQKDPLLTVDVIKGLADRDVEFMLDIVGDGELRAATEARARELGVAGRIAWHPPSKEMARWYRTADVLLMTSVFEGVPYVIYEALAMEVPVVAPALAGNVELMGHDGHCGTLVEPRGDVIAYVDALELLLADADHRREVGRRSRERIRATFPLSTMGSAHDALYEELLSQRPAFARRDDHASAPVISPRGLTLDRTTPSPRTVAVIMPCFQHGRFLRDAVASVHAQTLSAARIVVVDDASSDAETVKALEDVEQDPRVTVLRLPVNSGPSVARNRALALVEESYVLPLDADDVLFPNALEDMVAQLEIAGPDIGFVYPRIEHFGTRHDRYAPPAYNLHLLLEGNYCAATTLFDRRVFDADIGYPEDMIAGHEDWDLVLQLAARGVFGVPATSLTFKYRKHGFSRVNTVEYGPDNSRNQMRWRHPSLYTEAARAAIKARWAPALSVLFLNEDAGDSSNQDLGHQTCLDYDVRSVSGGSVPFHEAVHQARGRFVMVVEGRHLSDVRRPELVEQMILSLWDIESPVATVLAVSDRDAGPRFRLLGTAAGTVPAAVAWRRDPDLDLQPFDLDERSLLDSLVQHFEELEPLPWRAA